MYYHIYVYLILRQISRICRVKDRSLLFRGWSRLCLHAASLNASEGASAAATAAARAARADAMEKEAIAAAEKAEAWRKAAAASAAVAAAREQAELEAAGVSMSTADMTEGAEKWKKVVRAQQERRAKMVVRRDSKLDSTGSRRLPPSLHELHPVRVLLWRLTLSLETIG